MLLSFLTFVLVVCSMSSVLLATPYKDCGSELGVIRAFKVSDCPTVPCKFISGHNYSINVTFQAKASSRSANLHMSLIIDGVVVPLPLPILDVCQIGFKCPIKRDDINTVPFPFSIGHTSLPSSLYFQSEIKASDQNQDYTCLKFPFTVINGLSSSELRSWQQDNEEK